MLIATHGRLRPDQVLAQVNGVAIGPADLVPAGPGGERIMDPDMYRFLLDRAIDRELVFQAAATHNVSLTAQQKVQLEAARTALEVTEPDVVKELTRTPEQVEFELRDTAGLMLQTDLVAQAGPSPVVSPEEVHEYYEAHRSEFAALPEDPAARQDAWQRIEVEIRQRLGPETQATYQEAVRRYLDQLRLGAEIAKADPS